jgi:hypothetical protein
MSDCGVVVGALLGTLAGGAIMRPLPVPHPLRRLEPLLNRAHRLIRLIDHRPCPGTAGHAHPDEKEGRRWRMIWRSVNTRVQPCTRRRAACASGCWAAIEWARAPVARAHDQAENPPAPMVGAASCRASRA